MYIYITCITIITRITRITRMERKLLSLPIHLDISNSYVNPQIVRAINNKLATSGKLNDIEEKQVTEIDLLVLEQFGFRFMKSFPKKYFSDYCGRQNKTIDEHGRRYNTPSLLQRRINVLDFLREEFDFFSEHGKDFAIDKDTGQATGSAALERLRETKADREQIKLEQDRGKLVPAEAIWIPMQEIAVALKKLQFDLYNSGDNEAAYKVEEIIATVMQRYPAELQKDYSESSADNEAENSDSVPDVSGNTGAERATLDL